MLFQITLELSLGAENVKTAEQQFQTYIFLPQV